MAITEFEQRIFDAFSEIKSAQAVTNEHLRNLNSKVATNVINIEKNRCHNSKQDITIAKYLGAFSVVIFIVNFFIFKVYN